MGRRRLPKLDRTIANGDVTDGFPELFRLQRRLPPDVPREESQWLLRDRTVWGSLQTRGVTGGGEGVADGTPRVPSGNPLVSRVQDRDAAYFCRKIQRVTGADVYRKSTVDRESR